MQKQQTKPTPGGPQAQGTPGADGRKSTFARTRQGAGLKQTDGGPDEPMGEGEESEYEYGEEYGEESLEEEDYGDEERD